MSYPLVKETGTWVDGSHSDSWPKILEKLGVPPDMMEQVLAAQYPVEVTVDGDSITHKITEFGETSVNTFKLGVEFEEKDSSGSRKVTHTMEGDTLISYYPDFDGKGTTFRTVRRFLDDNTLRTDVKCGDLEGWTENKKV